MDDDDDDDEAPRCGDCGGALAVESFEMRTVYCPRCQRNNSEEGQGNQRVVRGAGGRGDASGHDDGGLHCESCNMNLINHACGPCATKLCNASAFGLCERLANGGSFALTGFKGLCGTARFQATGDWLEAHVYLTNTDKDSSGTLPQVTWKGRLLTSGFHASTSLSITITSNIGPGSGIRGTLLVELFGDDDSPKLKGEIRPDGGQRIFRNAELRFTGYSQVLGFGQRNRGDGFWVETRFGENSAPRRNVAHERPTAPARRNDPPAAGSTPTSSGLGDDGLPPPSAPSLPASLPASSLEPSDVLDLVLGISSSVEGSTSDEEARQILNVAFECQREERPKWLLNVLTPERHPTRRVDAAKASLRVTQAAEVSDM